MSKLGCECGHVIRDQTDNLPYKARFLRDQDDEAYHAYCEDIAAFIDAIQADKRAQWIKNHFSDIYPTDISNAAVINDIITNYELKYEGDMYQCVSCGRVLIQVEDKNFYASFLPGDEKCLNIFKRFRE
jgi:peptide methionine sulfoxide reductase MsrB